MLNHKQAVQITKKVIATHAPLILKELGLTNEEGILDRIVAKEEIDKEYEHMVVRGRFNYEAQVPIIGEPVYEKGSGHIILFPNSVFTYNKPGTLQVMEVSNFVKFFISKKKFECLMIQVLAHELRHYWQLITGECWKHDLRVMGKNFTPYSMRWEEKDADAFSVQYMRKHLGK